MASGNISRVLIANRGEIAVRIIKACRSLGLGAVVAVSEADRDALPAKMADRAVCVGPARSADSYLNIGALVTAAKGAECDTIHPGYGFLAESAALAEACQENGLTFVGPSADNIRQMGNKIQARRIVQQAGAPTIPGSQKLDDLEAASDAAQHIGYPVFLKSAAGGGGKGMRTVYSPQELASCFDTLSAEVKAAFGDGTLYLEKCIPNARHIEVQVIGDKLGQVIHLFERDCSIQRRHQKLIEEAPSPAVNPELRSKITSTSLKIARQIGYESTGTVEFILDLDSGQFYFLEMNTRVQVEHPVTELITGVDIVKEQLNIAGNNPLSIPQEEVKSQGHALECRINAEAWDKGFMPSPGKITQWSPPNDQNVRLDSHCFQGYTFPVFYDSLMAKIIYKSANRAETIEGMRRALAKFKVSGVETTIGFHQKVLQHPDFLEGNTTTRWLEESFLNSDGASHE